MKSARLFFGVVSMSVLMFPLSLGAEIVARALVTQSEGFVKLYTVDENNTWTEEREIVGYNTQCPSPSHAVYKNGVIYVSNFKSGDKEVFGIYKFDLQGKFLGVIETPECAAEGLAITPKGDLLFVGAVNKVLKIELATETVSVFYDF
jgi:hypothetical protein